MEEVWCGMLPLGDKDNYRVVHRLEWEPTNQDTDRNSEGCDVVRK